MTDESNETIYTCSFCKKSSDEYEFIVLGPDKTINICNSCIRACEAIAVEQKLYDTNFIRFPGEVEAESLEKIRPITRIPKTWLICDTDLYRSKPNVIACSPDGKKSETFSIPIQLAHWIIRSEDKLDIDKIREEIKSDICATVREVLRKY